MEAALRRVVEAALRKSRGEAWEEKWKDGFWLNKSGIDVRALIL